MEGKYISNKEIRGGVGNEIIFKQGEIVNIIKMKSVDKFDVQSLNGKTSLFGLTLKEITEDLGFTIQ